MSFELLADLIFAISCLYLIRYLVLFYRSYYVTFFIAPSKILKQSCTMIIRNFVTGIKQNHHDILDNIQTLYIPTIQYRSVYRYAVETFFFVLIMPVLYLGVYQFIPLDDAILDMHDLIHYASDEIQGRVGLLGILVVSVTIAHYRLHLASMREGNGYAGLGSAFMLLVKYAPPLTDRFCYQQIKTIVSDCLAQVAADPNTDAMIRKAYLAKYKNYFMWYTVMIFLLGVLTAVYLRLIYGLYLIGSHADVIREVVQ